MSNTNNTYNGWTNYATWRVNLEFFDCAGAYYTPDECQAFVEESIEESSSEGIARSYAMAFLSDVNWYEISQHLEDYLETDDESGEE